MLAWRALKPNLGNLGSDMKATTSILYARAAVLPTPGCWASKRRTYGTITDVRLRSDYETLPIGAN